MCVCVCRNKLDQQQRDTKAMQDELNTHKRTLEPQVRLLCVNCNDYMFTIMCFVSLLNLIAFTYISPSFCISLGAFSGWPESGFTNNGEGS